MVDKTTYVGVKMPPEDAEALADAAKKEDLTKSQLIRKIVREYLCKKK